MADTTPAACSLNVDALRKRLEAIVEVGAGSLISRDTEGGNHILRFRASTAARQQLELLVVAEAECCSFLDLSLSEEDGELILSIAAPKETQAIADGLAEAFAGQGH